MQRLTMSARAPFARHATGQNGQQDLINAVSEVATARTEPTTIQLFFDTCGPTLHPNPACAKEGHDANNS
jgi:hypothetical protein